MKVIKIRSDISGISLARSDDKVGSKDCCMVAMVTHIPNSMPPEIVVQRFRHTLIDTKRCVIKFQELGLNKIVR